MTQHSLPSLQHLITQRYPAPIERALHCIGEVLRPVLKYAQALDKNLAAYFRQHKSIGNNERYWIAEAVYEVVRQNSYYDCYIERLRSDTRLALYRSYAVFGLSVLAEDRHRNSISFLGENLRTDLQAIRQHLKRPPMDIEPYQRYSLPQWLWNSLCAQTSEKAMYHIANTLQEAAHLDVRVRRQKMRRDDLLATLQNDGLAVSATVFSDLGIRFKHKINLATVPSFVAGIMEVQDEASQLVAQLVQAKRGEVVVDFCAGAGGKALAMADMMDNQGVIYACDIAEKRLAKLRPRLAKSGVTNIQPLLMQDENDPKLRKLYNRCDAVLVDAPCSGSGTLRRNPDMKWRYNQETVERLSLQQLQILSAAAKLLKRGGRLVYATCSVLDVENQEVIKKFLQTHPDFAPEDCHAFYQQKNLPVPVELHEKENNVLFELQLTPWQHGTDGFFAALMRRH